MILLKRIFALFVLLMLLAGCIPAPVLETPTPSTTATLPPMLSPTILPTTSTSLPTASPTALSTKAPTPTFPPLPPYDELVHQFDYDQSAPLDVQILPASGIKGMTVQSVQYTGANGKPVKAFLIIPPGKGPFAGMIYMHCGGCRKTEFLGEAIELASHGIVPLLVDAYYNRLNYGTLSVDDEVISLVIDLRRGIDLLQARPDVDPNRLGYVGHSYGAIDGGILAGVDKRIKTFIFMAGAAFNSRYFTGGNPSLDGYHYISHAAPNSIFFQFADKDQVISKDMADEYYMAASQPKFVQWYKDTHAFTNSSAREDRINWLIKELGLASP